MITIHEMLNREFSEDERTLVQLSDKLWKIGSVEEIKKRVSPELFILHIGINAIGNWKGEGWWGIISEQAELVPFLSEMLTAFQLNNLKPPFERILSVFPEYTIYSNNKKTYYDIINFLQNTHFKVADDRLNAIPPEQRKQMVYIIRKSLDELEELTGAAWGDNTEYAGWKPAIDYIKRILREPQKV